LVVFSSALFGDAVHGFAASLGADGFCYFLRDFRRSSPFPPFRMLQLTLIPRDSLAPVVGSANTPTAFFPGFHFVSRCGTTPMKLTEGVLAGMRGGYESLLCVFVGADQGPLEGFVMCFLLLGVTKPFEVPFCCYETARFPLSLRHYT